MRTDVRSEALSGGDAPSRQWRNALAGQGLLSRFGYLLITQIVLVVTGVGYWMITTRLVVPRDVGIASSAISTTGFLAGIGIIGIGSLLLVEMRALSPEEIRSVLLTGAALSGAVVFVLAAGVWSISRWLGPSLGALGANSLDALLFVLGASSTVVGTVLDNAAIGMRRGPAQLARNAIMAVGRLLLVLVILLSGHRNTTGLLFAWVIANVVSIAAAPFILGLHRDLRRPVEAPRALIERYRGLALRHHVLNLAITSVSFFLPFIAALSVEPREFAFFSTALLVSSSVLLPPALLAMSLFAEAAHDEGALRRHIRRTLPVGFGCCLFALALLEPLAPLALRLFGPEYSSHGATLLRLLLLGGVPYVVKDHYVSIRRAQGRLNEAARAVAIATILEVLGAALGVALYGVVGLCAGWAIATWIEGVRFVPVVRDTVGPLRRRSDRGEVGEEEISDRGSAHATVQAQAGGGHVRILDESMMLRKRS